MSKKYCKKWQVDNFTTRWGAPSEGLSGRTSKGSVGGGRGGGGGVQGRGQNSEVRKQPVGRGQRSEVGGQGEPNSRNSLCAQRAQLQSGRAGRWRSRVRTGTATRTDTDGHGRARTHKWGRWGGIVDAPAGRIGSEGNGTAVWREQRSEVGGQGEPNSRNSVCAQRAQLQNSRSAAGRRRSRVRTGTATRTDTDGHGRTSGGDGAEL